MSKLTLVCFAAALAITTAGSAFAQTIVPVGSGIYTTNGNTTTGSNGSIYTTTGNTTTGSDGSISTTNGGTTIVTGPDGLLH